MNGGRRPRPKLDDIPENVDVRDLAHQLEMLVWEMEPLVDFFQQTRGVLALLRWLGPVTTILLGAILVVLVIGQQP